MKAWKLSVAASFTYFVVMTGVLSVDNGAESLASPGRATVTGKEISKVPHNQTASIESHSVQLAGDNTTAFHTTKPTLSTEKHPVTYVRTGGPSIRKDSANEKDPKITTASAAGSGGDD